MYLVDHRRRGLGAEPSTGMPVAAMKSVVLARLKALHKYDLFLRDRTALEWLKDNAALISPLLPLLRSEKSAQFHDETHAFWTRLSDAERKSLVSTWVDLNDHGARLAHALDALTATAIPSQALMAEVAQWSASVDSFVARMEGVRKEKRIERRLDTHSWDPFSTLKTAGILVGVGVFGLLALGTLFAARRA